MSKGHVALPRTDNDGFWYSRCTCGWGSGADHFQYRWQVEDRINEHLAVIERVKANLRHGRANMKAERDWAKERMEDPSTGGHDREIWRILYEGLDQRLNDHDHTEQDSLF